MGLTDSIKDFFVPAGQGDQPDEKSRFVLTGQQALGGMLIYTVTDRETGVSYITKPGNDCPFTPLLGADGKPLLYK